MTLARQQHTMLATHMPPECYAVGQTLCMADMHSRMTASHSLTAVEPYVHACTSAVLPRKFPMQFGQAYPC